MAAVQRDLYTLFFTSSHAQGLYKGSTSKGCQLHGSRLQLLTVLVCFRLQTNKSASVAC